MRKLVLAIGLLLGLVFVFAQMAEMQAIVETLQRGDWRFLFLALLVEVAWIFNVAASYRAIYRTLGVMDRLENLAIMAAAANFVNVVAPSGGMGGMAVFISQARQRGQSVARVTVSGVLFVFFDYIGFLFFLALGLFVLFRRQNLDATEIIASAILLGIASVMGTLIYLGMVAPRKLGLALAGMARLVNRILSPFRRGPYLSEARAHAFAHDAADGLRSLRQQPSGLLVPAVLALSAKALLVTILWLVFLAFQVPYSIGTLVAGFSIGYLFLIVSPTPAGIGVVEGALTLALRSLSVPLSAATVVALAYRGVTFWAPLLFGMLAFRRLSRAEAQPRLME